MVEERPPPTMKLAGKTVEWLYSNDCAILPFRWSNVACCPDGLPNRDDGDYSPGYSSNIRFGREAQFDCRSMSRTSLKVPISESSDEATYGNSREASRDRDFSIVNEHAKSDCRSREYPLEKGSCVQKELTPLPPALEPTSVVTDRGQHLIWQEEKNQWISAAGVRTPADLERKLSDMYRIAAQNEAAVKKLTGHVTEVRTFLRQLHEMDRNIAKRKRRSDRASDRASTRRKRSRAGCVVVETQDSSTDGLRERKAGSLLDPQIMRSFGNLINSSA